MAGVADVARTRGELHDQDQRDQPQRLDRNRREDQHDRAIGPGERVGQQHPHDRAGSAHRGDRGGRVEDVGHRGDHQSGAHSAHQVVPEEPLVTPCEGEGRAEHPQGEHVEADVPDAARAVQPHVGERLPKPLLAPEESRGDRAHLCHDRREHLRHEDRDVRDQEVLDDLGSHGRAEAHLIAAASVHFASLYLATFTESGSEQGRRSSRRRADCHLGSRVRLRALLPAAVRLERHRSPH